MGACVIFLVSFLVAFTVFCKTDKLVSVSAFCHCRIYCCTFTDHHYSGSEPVSDPPRRTYLWYGCHFPLFNVSPKILLLLPPLTESLRLYPMATGKSFSGPKNLLIWKHCVDEMSLTASQAGSENRPKSWMSPLRLKIY